MFKSVELKNLLLLYFSENKDKFLEQNLKLFHLSMKIESAKNMLTVIFLAPAKYETVKI